MPTQIQNEQWTFEDLYNLLMERIEPELCTYNLLEVQRIYEKETKKEHKDRFEHYARCLQYFSDTLAELVDLTKTDLKAFQTEFFDDLKAKIKKSEEKELGDIEDSIQNL